MTPNISLNALPMEATTSMAPYAVLLLNKEISVLTREGITWTHANEAINVQNEIAQTHILERLESAMGALYAGVWFSPGTARLHIGVTTPRGRQIAESVAASASLRSYSVETPVRSTHAQLLAAQMQLNRRLAGLFKQGIVETSLVPQSNAVSIALGSGVSEATRAKIKREDVGISVNITMSKMSGENLHFMPAVHTTKCKAFAPGGGACEKPIPAGATIEGELKELCTAGPLAIPTAHAQRSETYILTAGHCLETAGVGKPWSAYNRVPEKKEIGPAGAYVFGAEGDFGVIKIKNPGEWALAGNTPLYASMAKWSLAGEPIETVPISEERLPLVGRSTCREGQTTGEACGKITKEGLSIEYDGHKVTGLIEWTKAEFEQTLQKGDSGGPFFSTAVVGVAEEGIADAGSGENLVGYDPLGSVLTELNAQKGLKLELLTAGNEVRRPLLKSGKGGALSKTKYTSSSGATTFETLSGSKITCTSSSGKGAVTNTEEGTSEMTFAGCEGFGAKCQTPGASVGDIVLSAGYLVVYINMLKNEAGFLLKFTETTIECGTNCPKMVDEKLKLRGSVMDSALPANKEITLSEGLTLSLSQSKGAQAISEYENEEGGKVKVSIELEGSGSKTFGFEHAGLSSVDELRFEESAELEVP